MPVNYTDISQPPAPDLGNPINSDLVALIAVKDGVVTDLVSGTTATGTPALIDDADGKGWLGECTFNVADIGLDLSVGANLSIAVVGKFKATNASDSDESCVEFLTSDSQYLRLLTNNGWDKHYPALKGAWASIASSTKSVTHDSFALVGANITRATTKNYNGELYLDGALSNNGLYAQVSSNNDLVTITVGNNDENIYLVALYSGHKTLAEFDSVNSEPWQLFSVTNNNEHVASASITLPGIIASGTMDHTLPVYSSFITAILPAITASGEITFSTPGHAANATINLPGIVASATADYALPVYSVNASITLPAIVASGTIDFNTPGYSASTTINLPGITAQSTIDYTLPLYTAAITVTLPAIEVGATVDFGIISYRANATVSLPGVIASANTDFVLPVYSALATVLLPSIQVSANTNTTTPGYNANASVMLPGIAASSTVDYSLPFYSVLATITLPGITALIEYDAPPVGFGNIIVLKEQSTTLVINDNQQPITLR